MTHGERVKSLVRKRLLHAAGLAAVAIVLLLIAIANVIVRGSRDAEVLRADLAARIERPARRTELERAEIAELARATRSPPPAAPASAATSAPASPDPMHPSHDASYGRDPSERPIHEWLQAVRLSRSQPGPAPPPNVVTVLTRIAPALDALAGQLSRDVGSDSAAWIAPGDTEGRRELEHAHSLLLAAACAESISPEGDPARGERLLQAAWSLNRALPVGIDNAGPGDLALAVMRQVHVADARAWDERIAELSPRARLADAFDWDAAARLARMERTIEQRKQPRPGWVPVVVQQALAGIATKHDLFFTARISAAEAALAQDARALDPCDDPWLLAPRATSSMSRSVPGEVRLRMALASASLAQADVALTRHVLLRRHGLEPPRDACGTQPLIERHEGDDRFVVGWRVPGSEEPGGADRERPRNHSPGWRTWPEPSLPGPSLDPFSFEAPVSPAPVLATAPVQ